MVVLRSSQHCLPLVMLDCHGRLSQQEWSQVSGAHSKGSLLLRWLLVLACVVAFWASPGLRLLSWVAASFVAGLAATHIREVVGLISGIWDVTGPLLWFLGAATFNHLWDVKHFLATLALVHYGSELIAWLLLHLRRSLESIGI